MDNVSLPIYFSSNLRVLRLREGLSQTELAERLMINRNKLASYESRNIEPKLSVLIRVSRYFEILIEDLLKQAITPENITSLNRKFKKNHNFINTNDSNRSFPINADFIVGHYKLRKRLNKLILDNRLRSGNHIALLALKSMEITLKRNDEIINQNI